MLKIIFGVVKKVIIAIFLIYGLNLLISSLGLLIPINLITIIVVGFLGIPGLCTLIAIFLLV